MNKSFLFSKIEGIDQKITLLEYVPCQCDFYLEVKIREFGGGQHYVRQCNQCGRQKGSALKTVDALIELKGSNPKQFDPDIEDKYYSELKVRNRRLSELRHERNQLLSILNEETESILLTQESKYNEEYQMLSDHIDAFIQSFGIDRALLVLSQNNARIKKEKRENIDEKLSSFSSEDELKRWLSGILTRDFHIYPEVSGVHITENLKVRIDYVLFPRKHLIDQGFEPSPFGIEVKHLTQAKNFSHKASRAIWQAVSYNDCEFSIKNKTFRLKFCLLFSNISFSDERDVLELYSDYTDEKKMKWMGMLNVANHAKVGVLKIIGKRNRVRGWSISFAGGTYFNCHVNGEKVSYELSNVNTINKVRVGNF